MSQASETIRELNDAFRTGKRPDLGVVVGTDGVQAYGTAFLATALQMTQAFTAFTPDNDPHGEHDFGSFTVDDELVYWKIDYFDQAMKYGSENPADEASTCRVLTIFLASEY